MINHCPICYQVLFDNQCPKCYYICPFCNSRTSQVNINPFTITCACYNHHPLKLTFYKDSTNGISKFLVASDKYQLLIYSDGLINSNISYYKDNGRYFINTPHINSSNCHKLISPNFDSKIKTLINFS